MSEGRQELLAISLMAAMLILCMVSHHLNARRGESKIQLKQRKPLWLLSVLLVLIPAGILVKVIPWGFGYWWVMISVLLYLLVDIYYLLKTPQP